MSQQKQRLTDAELYLRNFRNIPPVTEPYGSMEDLIDLTTTNDLISPMNSPRREETQSLGYINSKSNGDAKKHFVFKLPFNVEMPPKKRGPSSSFEEKYNPCSKEDLLKFVSVCSSGNDDGKNELMIMLKRLQKELSETEKERGLTLLFNYELFTLTYLLVKDYGTFFLTNCQYNVLKKMNGAIDNKGLLCGDKLSEYWDHLMDKYSENLKEVLFDNQQKGKLGKEKKFIRRFISLLSFSRNQFAICHTEAEQNFVKPNSIEPLVCSITGKEIKNGSTFNVYRFCFVNTETQQSQNIPNLTIQGEYIFVNTHSIAKLDLYGVENVLIKFVKSIIAFLNYRTTLAKKLNLWKEGQKFISQESVQKKIEVFQQDREFLFQCVFEFALLFNNFFMFLQFLKS